MSTPGAGPDERRSRMSSLWRERRARWTLPLVIIVIIAGVAVVDHLGSRQISQVDQPVIPPQVEATGGSSVVHVPGPWSGFNPNTPAGARSTTPSLLDAVLPSAYVITPKLVPQVNTDLLQSVEATATTPLTIQYVINPEATWSDGVPVTAEDFIYAWLSQRGDGVDVDGQPDRVASTLGYRDVASVTGSHGGRTVTVVFAKPYADWRIMFDHMVPAHIAKNVGWNAGFAVFDPAVDLSAGPLLLTSAADGTAHLVRNPSWWGTKSVLGSVTVSDGQDDASWIGPLASTTTAVSQPGRFTLDSLSSVSALPSAQSSIHPSLDFLSLEFNVKSSIGSHVTTRQAVAHAIDRTGLLNRLFGTVAPTLAVNQDHLAVAWQTSYSASTAAGEYAQADPAATDSLLKSLGYDKTPGTPYVDATGKPFSMRMAVEEGDPWIDEAAAGIAAQLRATGIGVVLVPVTGPAGLAAAAATNAYDMALVTRVSGPHQSITQGWYSDGTGRWGTNDLQNWSRFDDPQVDRLFVQASQELNPVTGGAIYTQVDDQLWDQMVALPLFGEPGLAANGVQVANATYNPSVDGILWNVALWTRLKPAPAPGHS
ncbi:MAG TPA: ABC transporter substrate-binding protein [Acidimicrobiales bacterium]